ncbi:condensation domain-containing protein [Dactylosporangium sp. NPDC005572]|uniref:condensation domain-containing protein n=1 Tax=Dactylosporangium sp. NPDC005572 TaxID=3156889 RepID=UPI0033A39076
MTESNIKLLTERLANNRDPAPLAQGADRVPLSLTQQALIRQQRSGLVSRNLHAAWMISPPPDPGRLEAAAQLLLRRHEILRTIYPADRRLPYQRVLDTPAQVVEHVKVDTADDTVDDAAVRRAVDGHAATAIDPSAQLPIRFAAFGTGDWVVLSVTVHQLAADDAALAQIVHELARGYAAAHDGAPPAQYRDFSAAQLRAATATPATDSDLGYWAEHLAAMPDRVVPVSNARTITADEITLRVHVDAAGPDAALLALIAGAIHREWGAVDIAIGVLDADRPTGAETVVGHFANRLVCRVRIDPDRSPAELAGAIASAAERALAHRGTRIERIAALAGSAPLPPFQVSYSRFRSAPPRLVLDGHQVQAWAHRTAVPPGADLAFAVWPEATGCSIEVTATPQLAAANDIDGFAARLAALAPQWAADPRRALGEQRRPGAGDAGAPDHALPPEPELARLTGLGGPPRGASEQALAMAIRAVLKLDDDAEVGREDTFFALGGDSLAALRLVARLQADGRPIEVQTVFLHPVLHELAAQIDQAGVEAAQTAPDSPSPAEPMSASGLDASVLAALQARLGAPGRQMGDR